MAYYVFYAVMSSGTALFPYPYHAKFKAGIIIYNDHIFNGHLIKRHNFLDALAAQVHICLGLYKEHLFTAYHSVPYEGLMLELRHIYIILGRQLIYYPESYVMLCLSILLSRISQSDYHIHILISSVKYSRKKAFIGEYSQKYYDRRRHYYFKPVHFLYNSPFPQPLN